MSPTPFGDWQRRQQFPDAANIPVKSASPRAAAALHHLPVLHHHVAHRLHHLATHLERLAGPPVRPSRTGAQAHTRGSRADASQAPHMYTGARALYESLGFTYPFAPENHSVMVKKQAMY